MSCPTPDPLSRQLAEAADKYTKGALRLVPVPVKQPLLVAFYGGPGTGKSTTAALVFGQLKQQGYNVELVEEVAKGMTWEDRAFALGHQPYLAAKQMRNYDRLTGKVDAILTDTSTLLSLVYGRRLGRTTVVEEVFYRWLVADWKERNTLNIFLTRDPSAAYNPAGRSQTQQQAEDLDEDIKNVLYDSGVAYHKYQVDREGSSHIDGVTALVKESLRGA